MVGGGIIYISMSELPMAGEFPAWTLGGFFPLASGGCRENVGDVQGGREESGA